MDVCTLVSLEMVIKARSCLIKVKENKRAEMNMPASLTYQTKMFNGCETSFGDLFLSLESSIGLGLEADSSIYIESIVQD